MDKNYKWKVLLIVGLVVFSLWKAYPLDKKINLGLDLQGGVQLLLQVDMDKVPEEARKAADKLAGRAAGAPAIGGSCAALALAGAAGLGTDAAGAGSARRCIRIPLQGA